jgi:hypothetical protein
VRSVSVKKAELVEQLKVCMATDAAQPAADVAQPTPVAFPADAQDESEEDLFAEDVADAANMEDGAVAELMARVAAADDLATIEGYEELAAAEDFDRVMRDGFLSSDEDEEQA